MPASPCHVIDPVSNPEYYLQEGCGLFAMACLQVAGRGSVWILSRKDGEKWSASIPYEVTHVLYRDDEGHCWDVRGKRSPERMAGDFHMTDDWTWKGPFGAKEMMSRFMGNSDRKPLYGAHAEIQELTRYVSHSETFSPLALPATQGVVAHTFERVKEGWQMQGTSWHAPGDGWLVAHDVYHHASEDQGSFAEELMSFGVQAWIERREDFSQKDENDDFDFKSSVCYVLEASKSHLNLPDPPPFPALCPDLMRAKWEEGYAGGLLVFTVESFRELTEEQACQLDAEDHVEKAVGWMAHGWELGRNRYPDPGMTRKTFENLELAMNTTAAACDLGSRVRVILDVDATWKIEALSMAPALRRPLRFR